MIYFVQRADGAIKIGMTKNYHQRMIELQAKHGKLALLGLMDGGRAIEKQLHSLFAEVRIVGDGLEWFRPVDSLRTFIDENTHKRVPGRGGILVVSLRNHSRIRDLANGMRVTHDDVINMALDKFIPEGEDPLMFGRKLLETTKPQETTES